MTIIMEKQVTFKDDCSELKKKKYRKQNNPKSLRAWSDRDTSVEEQDGAANISFMAQGETSEVRSLNCPNCTNLPRFSHWLIFIT